MEGHGSSSESSDPAQLLKRINVLENKLKSEKRQKKGEQLKLENVVYQISKQYNEIFENMVGIYLDQGRSREPVKVELEDLENVSVILKSLKETNELLGEDYGKIGSVLTDLLTLGGMVRRMKYKWNQSIITTTACEPARADVETPTSTTTVRNDARETRSDPSDQRENCSEDISIAEQRQFLECRDDHDGDLNEVGRNRKSHGQTKQSNPGTSTPSSTSLPLASPTSYVASTPAQAEQFSVDTSACGDGERRSRRLREIPRKTYIEQLEGCPARKSESGPRQQQPQSDPIRRQPMQRKRRSNVKEGPPGQKKKRRRRIYICPHSQCRKRFNLLSDCESHWCRYQCTACKEFCMDRESFEQHKKDMHEGESSDGESSEGESSGNDVAEMSLTEMAVVELEPNNRKGSSMAQARSTPGAVGEEMLCTNGVTISVSRKRPRKEPSSISRTSQVGLNLNPGSSGHGGKGTAPGLATGSSPRVKLEQD